MKTKVSREALLVAARRHQRPGISDRVALVLGYTDLVGYPLDPEAFDDAAVLLRAERLLMDDVPLREALRTACTECVTLTAGREQT